MTTERDLRNQMEYAKSEAIREGRAEGRAEGIATMLKAGVAVEVLAKAFGLTESECIQLIIE